MSIRKKLLMLLFMVSLMPLTGIFVLRQMSMRITRGHITKNIHATMDQNARYSLGQLLEHYEQMMVREQLLMEGLIRSQARETELWLNLKEGQKTQGLIEIYRKLSLLVSEDLLRQQTLMLDGIYTCYPAEMSPEVEARGKPWFELGQKTAKLLRVGPYIAPVVQQAVVTLVMPVRQANGVVVGMTAIDHLIPDLRSNMRLPEPWQEGTERLLVGLDKREQDSHSLTIFLHSRATSQKHSNISIEPQVLTSDDPVNYAAMINDIKGRQPGARRMGYRGTDALWAYGRASTGGVLPLLIVPYERVEALAAKIQQQLMGQSLLWWRLGGTVLAAVCVVMIVLGLKRFKAITEPIAILTEASARLAAGDYSTRTQIQTGDELETLGKAFNDIGPHLLDRERLRRSLEIAGAIQQNLLPKANPTLDNFDISAKCVYCDQTGGDYYDFISLEDQCPGKLGIALGDVTGHGIGAALLMAAVRGVFRQSAREFGDHLQTLFAHCNNQLAQDSDDDKFITLFYGILNSQDRSMIWASGGHDPALWYHVETDMIEELPNTGPPVGLFEGMAFEALGPISFGPGDILVIGTDGIWEAENSDENMFGRRRLKDLIRANQHKSAQALCDCITEAVLNFVAPSQPEDDVTLIVIKTH